MYFSACSTCSTIILPHSTNHIINKWHQQRQRHKSMIWLVECGKIIVLHVRHAFWCNFFHVVCITTTWKFQFWGSDNASRQLQTFQSLPLRENHSCYASESALRVSCTTWPTWNNCKTLNLMRSSSLMQGFRCSSRRSFLNSLSS